jgi:hypothetical protein
VNVSPETVNSATRELGQHCSWWWGKVKIQPVREVTDGEVLGEMIMVLAHSHFSCLWKLWCGVLVGQQWTEGGGSSRRKRTIVQGWQWIGLGLGRAITRLLKRSRVEIQTHTRTHR